MPHLKNIVEYTGLAIAGNGRRPTIESVFNALRKANLEVDLQTVSHIYENVFDLNDETFSTVVEVEAARSESFRKISEKRAQLIKNNTIGKDSPVTAVATQIANMISTDLKALPTVQKLMQERLAKAAKRVMEIKGKKLIGKTTEEILKEVLELENNNPYYSFGLMDNAETLFNEFKKEFSDLAEIAGAPYQAAGIQQYADILSDASYHFLLSTPEMQQIINDTLKDAGFTKQLKNGKTVVDFNKLLTSKVDFRDTVREVFSKKGFSAKDIERITDEIESDYNELKNAKAEQVLQDGIDKQKKQGKPKIAKVPAPNEIENLLNIYKAGNFTASQENKLMGLIGVDEKVRKIFKDNLIEAGYFKEDKDGNKLLDWEKILSEDQIDFGKLLATKLKNEGFNAAQSINILSSIKDNFGKYVEQKRKDELDEKEKLATDKKESRKQKSAIDKMLYLSQLGIFNNSQQQALFKIMGVSSANQQQVNALKGLMKQYNKAIKMPIANWSHTYIKTIQREIENIIEQIEEGDVKMMVLRYWGFISQVNSAAILANLQNITENTTSGLVEYMITLVRNPKQAAESAKIFWNVFKDIVSGGVREGNELSNAFNTSGNFEDRFNFETAKTTKQKIAAAIAQIQRTLLSSFDNAYKASITHLLTLNTMRKVLKKQGLSNEESILVVNEMYYGNRDYIEDVAKQLEDNLKAAGIKNVGGKWKRIAAEISMANFLSEGTFFSDTVERLKTEGKIDPSKNPQLNENLVRAIKGAADATAAKGLGHEADSQAFKLMDNISAGLNKNITEARIAKDKNALINAEIARNAYGMVNRFRSGALRWMWLSFQKSSGIALIQTLITDVARNKGKYLNFDNLNLSSDNQDVIEADIGKYLALRQRLARETLVPLISYSVGYGVILPAMLAAFKGDGDDEPEEKRYAKLAQWIEEDPARRRWIQKGLPLVVYNFLSKQVKRNYGEVSMVSSPNKPSWSDVIEPDIAAKALLNSFNESSLYKLAGDIKTELNKDEGSIGLIIGKFVGSFLNMGGFLKNYQLNSDAIKALQGKPTRMSKSEYNQIKPQDFVEGFLYNSLNTELYKGVINTENRAASSSAYTEQDKKLPDVIKKDYERTSDKDFLASEVSSTITYKGNDIKLTPDQHEKFIKMVDEKRKELIDPLISGDDYRKASDKVRAIYLQKRYDLGRERAGIAFLNSDEMQKEKEVINKKILEGNKQSEKQTLERSNK